MGDSSEQLWLNNILVREPDAGNPPVRFDEREVETVHTAPPLDSTRDEPLGIEHQLRRLVTRSDDGYVGHSKQAMLAVKPWM